jgi:hypothetical protein
MFSRMNVQIAFSNITDQRFYEAVRDMVFSNRYVGIPLKRPGKKVIRHSRVLGVRLGELCGLQADS